MQQQRREFSKPWLSTSPLPKSQPPVSDPPYEVIEFPPQQLYSNTAPSKVTKSKPNEKYNERKCDLCGSSSAQIHCNMCTQQTFCSSCDLMYHRHPKRQSHTRQRIPNVPHNCGKEPPLPPKGEHNLAPIPPPRRNKRSEKLGTQSFSHHSSLKKDGSFMGSLKRLVGGKQSTTLHSKTLRKESQPTIPHFLRPSDFEHQPSSRDNGYLDWKTENRHRAGSFTSFNTPVFTPLAQAQSMAQLNCSSCHSHGMSSFDWNRSQMNLNTLPPWPAAGYAPGTTWHAPAPFPPTYRLPPNDLQRRANLNPRQTRRDRRYSSEEETESDLFVNGDRSLVQVRGLSPALSRRTQRATPSETEEESLLSKKNDRRLKKRSIALSREPSPALSRRGYRKKYEDDEDDKISMRSYSSRRSMRSLANKSFPRRNTRRSSSDSDDELTSNEDVSEAVVVAEGKPPSARPLTKFTERPQQMVKAVVKPQLVESDEKKTAEDEADWQCEHCTYLNVSSSRVCDVCCKSRGLKISEKAEDEAVMESMKNMNVSNSAASADEERKKGDCEGGVNTRAISTPTSLRAAVPQTISTQTYDVASGVKKQNHSISGDDYSDWNPIKKSSSTTSYVSDNKSSSMNNYAIINAMLKNQVKHGLEVVKLLKEAENYQFTVEDLTAALAQCGDMNPIHWLLENWNEMIDTVVTLSTNYGREQPENTIGTISTTEARAALRIHNGDLWSAATECIRQRQRKYDQLMTRGNFTREDVVTVLTANHGDMEVAYLELNKSQLKPFLMKIWGPPQGLDNDSGDTSRLLHNGKPYRFEASNNLHHSKIPTSNPTRVRSWLETVTSPQRSQSVALDDIKSHQKGQRECVTFNRNLKTSSHSMLRYNSYDNLRMTNINKKSKHSKLTNQSLESLTCQNGDNRAILHVPKDDEELDVDIYDYLIKEYVKFKIQDKSYLEYSDDTEDDPVSDLPLDSGRMREQKAPSSQNGSNSSTKLPVKKPSKANSIHGLQPSTEYVNTIRESFIPTSKLVDSVPEPRVNESSVEYSTANDSISSRKYDIFKPFDQRSKIEKVLLTSNDVTSETFVHSKFVNDSLFAELNALYLLTKQDLDKHVIEMKDSDQNASIVKAWINDNSHIINRNNDLKTPDRLIVQTSDDSSDQWGDEVPIQSGKIMTEFNETEELKEQKYDHSSIVDVESPDGSRSMSLEDEFNEKENEGDREITDETEKEEEDVENDEKEHKEPTTKILNETTSNSPTETQITTNEKVQTNNEKIFTIPKITPISTYEYKYAIENAAKNNFVTVGSRWKMPKANVTQSNFICVNVTDQVIEAIKLIHEGDQPQENGIVKTDEDYTELNPEVKDEPINVLLKPNQSDSNECIKKKKSTNLSSSNQTTNITANLLAGKLPNKERKAEFDAPERSINILGSNKIDLQESSRGLKRVVLHNQDNTVSFEAKAQEYLSNGHVTTYKQAELAIQLMELKFNQSQCIEAATECSSIYAAIAYLQQECQLCAEKFSMKQMVSFLECEHQCCHNCAQQFYSLQITENNIEDCVCPFCLKPELRAMDADALFNYFSNLDILLKSILKPATHELFQQKLRDRTLMQDPNFKWCVKCSFGFIADMDEKRISCPLCKALTCAKCGNLWTFEHENKTCEQYKQWLENQDDSNFGLTSYMENHGIMCPQCQTKFILIKGGCMHLTCSRCKYEFCSDCLKPFSMGTNCHVSDYCIKLGLHAHHPRNCLFYLRDKEPMELKQLLTDNNIEVKLQPSNNQRCIVQLQKETESGLVDIHCGAQVEEAGLCKIHYIEYLANLIRKNKIDPVTIFDLAEILQEFRRRGKSLPVRPANTFEHEYRSLCMQIVKKELPLE